MNINLQRISFLVMTGIIITYMLACETRQSASSSELDSLVIRYQALADSVDANWSVMIKDDDEKHFLMKRLLLEVSYTNNYDEARFEELNTEVEQLKALRYDQVSMSSSDLIDEYDSATWDLTDQIIQFAREHPRYADFPMMEELISDINDNNNYVLMHRIHYDSWVKKLNAFKKEHVEELLQVKPGLEAEPMPLFELSS
jgi:hypothetical protein